jgi:hypothetical protein
MRFGEYLQLESASGAEYEHLAFIRYMLSEQECSHALHADIPRHHSRWAVSVARHVLRIGKCLDDLAQNAVFRDFGLELFRAAIRLRTSALSIASVTLSKRARSKLSASRKASLRAEFTACMAEQGQPATSETLSKSMDTNPVVLRRIMAGLRQTHQARIKFEPQRQRDCVRFRSHCFSHWRRVACVSEVAFGPIRPSPTCDASRISGPRLRQECPSLQANNQFLQRCIELSLLDKRAWPPLACRLSLR